MAEKSIVWNCVGFYKQKNSFFTDIFKIAESFYFLIKSKNYFLQIKKKNLNES